MVSVSLAAGMGYERVVNERLYQLEWDDKEAACKRGHSAVRFNCYTDEAW